MEKLESIVKTCLRRKLDSTAQTPEAFWVILPTTEKQNAVLVAERIQSSFIDYLNKESLANQVKIQYRVIGYPDDAGSEEELMQMAA